MKRLFRAAYVATMAGPVLENAAIVVEDGRIVEVGTCDELLAGKREPYGADHVIDFGRAVILPGLVNAHTHLELTNIGQLPDPASFVDWILALRKRVAAVSAGPEQIARSTENGLAECLKSGVTTVGDITLNPAITRAVIQGSPIRAVSFGEVLGMAGRAGQMEERIAAAVMPSTRSNLRIGIEPHSPYSLDLVGYRRCLEEAKRHAVPLATHLAETPDEAEFLASHSGAFRRLWETLGGWQEGVSRAEGGPIRAMKEVGLLDYPTVLAHVNYVDDAELEILAQGKASVVYCPWTHAYFGHPPHRFVEMLARGINVAVGTDSAASAPDLDFVEELRLIHMDHPELPVEVVFEMATIRGARALGMADQIGTIEPGKSADFCVFKVNSREPLRELLESFRPPFQVWIDDLTA